MPARMCLRVAGAGGEGGGRHGHGGRGSRKGGKRGDGGRCGSGHRREEANGGVGLIAAEGRRRRQQLHGPLVHHGVPVLQDQARVELEKDRSREESAAAAAMDTEKRLRRRPVEAPPPLPDAGKRATARG